MIFSEALVEISTKAFILQKNKIQYTNLQTTTMT